MSLSNYLVGIFVLTTLCFSILYMFFAGVGIAYIQTDNKTLFQDWQLKIFNDMMLVYPIMLIITFMFVVLGFDGKIFVNNLTKKGKKETV